MRPPDMTDLAVLRERHPHGTRVRYMTGCKCMLCRAANSRYSTERSRAIKAGDWNGIVSSDRARAHLLMLSRHGVGRYVVADACGLSPRLIAEIRSGRQRNMRSRNERRILSVTAEARGAGTLVHAGPVWVQINRLLREGFTKGQLARRLGNKTAALQIRRHVVTAKTAMRVEKLHAELMAGGDVCGRRQPVLRSIAQGSYR